MSILEYTSYDQIRAVLGVSDTDIVDETLALPIYSQRLQMALRKIHPSLSTLYKDIENIPEDQRTSLQEQLYNVTQVYAAYYLGFILLSAANMFAFKKLKDGKAEGDRFDDPFAALRDDLSAEVGSLENLLEDLLEQMGEEFTPRAAMPLVAISNLDIDPVTNI